MFNAMVIFIAFYYNLCPSTKIASIFFSVFGVLNIINKIFEIEIYYYPMFRVSVLTVIFIYSIIIFIKKWFKTVAGHFGWTIMKTKIAISSTAFMGVAVSPIINKLTSRIYEN